MTRSSQFRACIARNVNTSQAFGSGNCFFFVAFAFFLNPLRLMSGITRQFLRSSPPMDLETESNSESLTNDENGLRHQRALALYLCIGITPIVLFLILPFVERRYNTKRRREEAKHRLTATKLAEPIREAHLLNLMKGYTTVSLSICEIWHNECFFFGFVSFYSHDCFLFVSFLFSGSFQFRYL